MRKVVMAVCAALALGSIVATVRADSGTPYFKIRDVGLFADGSVAYITPEGSAVNPDGCAASGMYVVERDVIGDAAFDGMVRQFNAAMLANKRVRVWLDGCSTAPVNGSARPVIQQLYVYRD